MTQDQIKTVLKTTKSLLLEYRENRETKSVDKKFPEVVNSNIPLLANFMSPCEIARELGISRSAIYARVRGNRQFKVLASNRNSHLNDGKGKRRPDECNKTKVSNNIPREEGVFLEITPAKTQSTTISRASKLSSESDSLMDTTSNLNRRIPTMEITTKGGTKITIFE
ncbi:MAG: hypothetical protein AABY36_10575 [Campylobacterota bacterium]